MSGDALEVALALLRVPAMRMSLRQRPLPDDVGGLIELAAGAPVRVASAAARTGEAPEQVLEAARFYVREVLLFAGADAYRVLGVARDASADRIKLHHRHLQHWLHPDRRGNDWESIYATRINAAWADLRSPERRAAYDARHAQGHGPDGNMPDGSMPTPHRVLVPGWRAFPFHETNWRGWLALGVGIACCLWLVVLADRQASEPGPEWATAAGATPATRPNSLATTLGVAVERVEAMLRPGERTTTPAPPVPEPWIDPAAVVPARVTPAVDRSEPAAVTSGPVEASAKPLWAEASLGKHAAPVDDATATREKSLPVSPDATEPAVLRDLPSSPSSFSTSTVQAGPAPAASPPAALSPERVRLVQRRGRELTRYLTGNSGRVPPIWHSVAAQDLAASIRGRLDGSGLRLGDPDWRIVADHATMTSTLQGTGKHATLRAEFAWRDGMWLVEHLDTENLP